jgi:hypothetical protein
MFFPSIRNEDNKIQICIKEDVEDKINNIEDQTSKKEKEFCDEKEKVSSTVFTIKIEKEHEKEKILLENYFNEKLNILKLENIRLHQSKQILN